MKRIVYILHHSVTPFLPHLPKGVDVRLYDSCWHVFYAQHLVRRYPGEYLVECWRPEYVLKEKVRRCDELGIVHRLFPSLHFRKYNDEFSPDLLTTARKMSRDGNTVFEVHGIYNFVAYSVLFGGLKAPIVGQSHGGWPALVLYRASKRRWLRHLYLAQHLLERASFPRFSQIFAISTYERDLIKSVLPGARVSLRPAGVDFDLFSPGDRTEARHMCGLSENDKVILFVGRLEPLKGPQYLIEAFPQVLRNYPNAQLVIIGNGNGAYTDALQRLANELGISMYVKFVGYIPNQALPQWYRAADVFVLPSIHEGFGVVCVEAMACGIPLVGTNTGGVPDIVREFECGLLVPPKDIEALAEAICQVLAEPDAFRPNVEKGRRAFDWNVVIDERVELYDNLLGL